ncbi:hypothetical protein Tco_0341659 [Tanacetum coccineum]
MMSSSSETSDVAVIGCAVGICAILSPGCMLVGSILSTLYGCLSGRAGSGVVMVGGGGAVGGGTRTVAVEPDGKYASDEQHTSLMMRKFVIIRVVEFDMNLSFLTDNILVAFKLNE